MKRMPVWMLVLLAGIWLLQTQWPAGESAPTAPDNIAIHAAFEQRASDVLVQGRGTVVRVLPPDNDGRPHQRFVLDIGNGQTVLVAHNLTLADPLPGLRRGDEVLFSGEYEWNDRGGVVHWTHHDPAGRRAGGWLEYRGVRYR